MEITVEEKFKWVDEINSLLVKSSELSSDTQKAFMFTTGLSTLIDSIWESGYNKCKETFVNNANKN